MTHTATIIKNLEAATTVKGQQAVIAANPTDGIFRDFLRRVFDPFWQYGTFTDAGVGSLDGCDLDELNETLGQEWAHFTEVLDGLVTGACVGSEGFTPDDVVEAWSESPAWPIYARCFFKGLGGSVTFSTVNGVWRDIPTFDPAMIAEGRVTTFPVFVEPVLGRRRLMVIHDPYRDGASKVDVFSTYGLYVGALDGTQAIVDALSDFRHALWLNEDAKFSNGIVLDGTVDESEDSPRYLIFDVLPLTKFKAHKPFAAYTERRALLQAMTEIVEPGAEPFYPLISTECGNADTLQKIADETREDAKRGRVRGLVAKYPNVAYPHGAKSGTWVWAYKKD